MKRSNVFIGRELYSCGACSIESILSFYNGYVPHETVLEDTNTTKTGTNAYNIVKALERYGFNAFGLKMGLDNIKKEDLPLIAHTTIDNYNHFLVIYEINDKKVITMDPKWGAKTYSKEEFKQIFNEIVIIARPVRKIIKIKQKNTLKKLLIKNFYNYRTKIIILLNISIITIVLGLIISAFVKLFDIKHVYAYTAIFIEMITIKWLLNYFKVLYEQKIENNIKSKFNSHIIGHIFHLENRYIKNRRVGEIICKINDSSFIIDFFTRLVFDGSIDIISFMLCSILLFIISVKMSLINLSFAIIYAFIAVISARKAYRKEIERIESFNAYSGDLTEYFEGIDSIKNLGFEDMYLKRLNNSYKKYINTYENSIKYNAFMNLIKSCILEIGYIISLAVALNSLGNSLVLYDIIIYSSIYSLYASAIANIMSYIPGYMHIKAIYRSVSEFLDLNSEKNGTEKLEDLNNINIHDLKYTYDQEKYVLKVDDINIKKGDKVLLMGASGKGKSTLVKCLSGYLRDYTGIISIDGVDIKDVSLPDLKKIILYIGQDEKLFTDTIKNNITNGLIDDIKFSHIIDLCELPELIHKKLEKENALILEGGINFSEGEKARIILARGLYKSPKVLIIDELLSSLPEEQENRILNRLLQEDITLIYITHRNKLNYFKKYIDLGKG